MLHKALLNQALHGLQGNAKFAVGCLLHYESVFIPPLPGGKAEHIEPKQKQQQPAGDHNPSAERGRLLSQTLKRDAINQQAQQKDGDTRQCHKDTADTKYQAIQDLQFHHMSPRAFIDQDLRVFLAGFAAGNSGWICVSSDWTSLVSSLSAGSSAAGSAGMVSAGFSSTGSTS
jgi:hypothetical protein